MLRRREDVRVEDTWEMGDLYGSDEAWEQDFEIGRAHV